MDKLNISLRNWTLDDKESLANICNKIDRTYLSNRIPHPYTLEDAIWWLNMVLKHDGIDGVFRSINANGKIVGSISVEQKQDIYSKTGLLGYFVIPNYYSKGIVTEATKQICEIAFSQLDILRITADVCEENIASNRVLEKNNFILEGNLKNAFFKDGILRNVNIYGKLK